MHSKSPFLAAVLGALFGFLGVGIYLASWKHFLICFAIQMALIFILAPITPINLLASWAAAAIYGFTQAKNT